MNRPAATTAVALAAGCLVLGAGCAGTDEITSPTLDVPETVAMGVLPEPLSDSPTVPPPPAPPTSLPSPGATDPQQVPRLELPLGDQVDGDRLIFIGDGTLASAAPGADRQLCDALSVFGWEAEIDAFAGTDNLSYVEAVLDLRLRPEDGLDWDVAVLWVGNELPADDLGVDELTATLDAAIQRLAPRPVVLYTLSELDDGRERFNDVIRSRADEHANVAVVDWAELGGAAGEVLELDGVTLSLDGRKRLPLITAQTLGPAPLNEDGGCSEGVDTSTDG